MPTQGFDPPDLELVKRCQEGDREAFRILVERYQARATRLAYRYVGNMDDAQDITQDAFIRDHRSIKDFRNETQFYTWFYRILVNLALDLLRRNRMKPPSSRTACCSEPERIGRADGRQRTRARSSGRSRGSGRSWGPSTRSRPTSARR
jgi:RNA polymerase sigma factor (sigma-70 family)